MIPTDILNIIGDIDNDVLAITSLLGIDLARQRDLYSKNSKAIRPLLFNIFFNLKKIEQFLVGCGDLSEEIVSDTFISEGRVLTLAQWTHEIKDWVRGINMLDNRP